MASQMGEEENLLGIRCWTEGRLEEAIAAFRAALRADPSHRAAARNLGNALREDGRLDEAIEWFERAIAIDPKDGTAHRYLVETRTFVDEPHRARMETLAQDSRLDAEQRIDLHFALATALTRSGRYGRAFHYLREANALKRAGLVYDESRERLLMRSLRAMFSSGVVRRMRGCGDPSPRPVFIVGMPRSGTSLVEQILAAHPDVHAAGELEAFARCFNDLSPIAADPNDEGAFAYELAAALRDLGGRYLTCAGGGATLRVTDKMPSNFRFAAAIHLALPNAKIVHVRRSALDTCFSCYETHFSDGHEYAYDLRELGRYYRLYDEHMAHARALLPGNVMLDIDYEQIVGDFEASVRRIVDHCGLDWHAACLEPWRVRRPVRTASVVQVRRKIYATSVGRWKPYERELQPLIEALRTAHA